MDEKELIEYGKRLQEEARNEVALLQFMLKEAGPVAWAKAHQEDGNKNKWAIEMNKCRDKRAATLLEADEIVRRARKFFGNSNDCIEFLQRALCDPAWALKNMRDVSEHFSEGVVI